MYFVKNIGRHLRNKCNQKLPDSVKKSSTYAIKTASNKEIQKTVEVSGDLI